MYKSRVLGTKARSTLLVTYTQQSPSPTGGFAPQGEDDPPRSHDQDLSGAGTGRLTQPGSPAPDPELGNWWWPL